MTGLRLAVGRVDSQVVQNGRASLADEVTLKSLYTFDLGKYSTTCFGYSIIYHSQHKSVCALCIIWVESAPSVLFAITSVTIIAILRLTFADELVGSEVVWRQCVE